MNRFVDVVILPEVFLRVYQVFFGLSKSEAEKHISNSVSSDEDFFVSTL